MYLQYIKLHYTIQSTLNILAMKTSSLQTPRLPALDPAYLLTCSIPRIRLACSFFCPKPKTKEKRKNESPKTKKTQPQIKTLNPKKATVKIPAYSQCVHFSSDDG